MSEQWLGLHNVHQHQPISQNVAGETTQGWICTESEPCRLCLAAEVEALREREGQSLDVNALLSELAMLRHGLSLLRERRDIAYRTWQGYPEGTRGRKTWGKRLNALDAALADFDGGDA